MIDLDALVNKTVPFQFMGARLSFDLSHALFSSFEVDSGTRLLMKAAAADPFLAKARRVLDAGCGTGVIGLSVAKVFPDARVRLRDRDLLAVAFSARNRAVNGLDASRIEIVPGLLADGNEEGPYDYVLSNLPAKAGHGVLQAFIRSCASGLLSPDGRLAFVIVNTLAAEAEAWCLEARLKIVVKEAGPGHTVFVAGIDADEARLATGAPLGDRTPQPEDARPAAGAREAEGARPPDAERHAEGAPGDVSAPAGQPSAGPAGCTGENDASPPDLSVYRRGAVPLEVPGGSLEVCGFWGLPEFDTMSHATELAIASATSAAAGSLVREALVVEPGTGLCAAWACATLGARTVRAVSRDYLSLEAVRSNLVRCGFGDRRCETRSWLDLDGLPDASSDLAVWFPDIIPRFDWTVEAWRTLARVLKTGAAAVIVSTPTEIARLLRSKPSGMRTLGGKKRKGYASLACRREA